MRQRGIMMGLRAVCICCLFILGLTMTDVWESFLTNPNAENYRLCNEEINRSLAEVHKDNHKIVKTATVRHLIKDDNKYNKFLQLIQDGNAYAASLGFHIRHLTDGGAAEDLDISLGKTVHKNPRLFLSLFDECINSHDKPSSYDTILLNLGSEYVDDFPAQVREMQKRLNRIQGINDDKLRKAKAMAIKILTDGIAEQKEIIIMEQKRTNTGGHP